MSSAFSLKSTLGRSYNVDLDDTLRTKKTLRSLGHYQTPSYGMTEYPDEQLFDGIKDFQKAHGLHVDGVMKPEGETASRLGKVINQKERERREESTRSSGWDAVKKAREESERKASNRSLHRAASNSSWAAIESQNAGTRNRTTLTSRTAKDLRTSSDAGSDSASYGTPKTPLGRTFKQVAEGALQSKSDSSTEQKQAKTEVAALPLVLPSIAEIAAYFGISTVMATAWWHSMSSDQRKKMRQVLHSEGHDGSSEDANDKGRKVQCDYQYDHVDTPVCRAIKKRKGAQEAQRCWKTAADRYEACLRGVEPDDLPPLDIWNN